PVIDAERPRLRNSGKARDQMPQRARRPDLVAAAVKIQQHPVLAHPGRGHPLRGHAVRFDRFARRPSGRRGADRPGRLAALGDRQAFEVKAAQQLPQGLELFTCHVMPSAARAPALALASSRACSARTTELLGKIWLMVAPIAVRDVVAAAGALLVLGTAVSV